MISPHAELSVAVLQVNEAFQDLPADAQRRCDLTTFEPFDREIDEAILAGDRSKARAAISEWRDRCLRTFRQEAAA